jgi:hypothetical protein
LRGDGRGFPVGAKYMPSVSFLCLEDDHRPKLHQGKRSVSSKYKVLIMGKDNIKGELSTFTLSKSI